MNTDAFIDLNEPYTNFLEWDYFYNVFNIIGIFVAFILSEAFSYTVLMYFNKKASVSKATLFGALHALFVVIMKYIFDVVDNIDSCFM